MKKTKGELEAAFTKAITKLEKDYLGRGPLDARRHRPPRLGYRWWILDL